MAKKDGFPIVGLIAITVVVAGILGWILNIGALINAADAPITAMFVLRCVGIFVAPLGSVLGYL